MNARRVGCVWMLCLAPTIGAGAGEFAGFEEPVLYPTSTPPGSIRAGDLDSDGDVDLVTTHDSGNSIGLHFNRGDGTFDPVINMPIARSMRDVAIADLNNDAIVDLIAVSNGSPLDEPFDAVGRVCILRGLGAGEFDEPDFYFAGTQPVSVAVGDLNADGWADLVVANQLSGNVSVFLNDASGSPLDPNHYPVGSVPQGVAIADLNKDFLPEIISANFFSNDISILLNTNHEMFQPLATIDSPNFTSRTPAIADLDNDGFPEIGLAKGLSESMGIHPNIQGVIDGEILHFVGGPIRNGAFVKLDCDQEFDLVATGKVSSGASGEGPLFAVVAFGDAVGVFQRPATIMEFNVEQPPQSQCEADFDGDGSTDIAVALNLSVAVLQNRATSTRPFDLNGDGFTNTNDLVLLLRSWGQPGPADFDESGMVDGRDLAHLLVNWSNSSTLVAPNAEKGALE